MDFLRLLVGVIALLLSQGCALTKPPEVKPPRVIPPNPPAPEPIVLVDDSEALLVYVGDAIATIRANTAVFGSQCSSARGAAAELHGACLGALMRVASRTPATVKVTAARSDSVYNGPSVQGPVVPWSIQVQPGRDVPGTALVLEDMVIVGSVDGVFSGQTDTVNGAIEASAFSAARTGSIAYTNTDMRFWLMRRETGEAVGVPVMLRATTWEASAGQEVGAYITGSVNGKSRGFGVRVDGTRTIGVNQVAVQRNIAGLAVAILMSRHYGISLDNCNCVSSLASQGTRPARTTEATPTLRVIADNAQLEFERGAELTAWVTSNKSGALTCFYHSVPNQDWLLISPTRINDIADNIDSMSPVKMPRNRGGGSEIRITLTEIGEHKILCYLTSTSVAKLLPKGIDLDAKRPYKKSTAEFAEFTRGLFAKQLLATAELIVTARAPDKRQPAAVDRPSSCRCVADPTTRSVTCTLYPGTIRSNSNVCPSVVTLQLPEPGTSATRNSSSPIGKSSR